MEMCCKALTGRQEKIILLIFYLHLWNKPMVSVYSLIHSSDLATSNIIHEVTLKVTFTC